MALLCRKLPQFQYKRTNSVSMSWNTSRSSIHLIFSRNIIIYDRVPLRTPKLFRGVRKKPEKYPQIIELPYDPKRLTYKQRIKGFFLKNALEIWYWFFACVPYPPTSKYKEFYPFEYSLKEWNQIFWSTIRMTNNKMLQDFIWLAGLFKASQRHQKKKEDKREIVRELVNPNRRGVVFPGKYELTYFTNATQRSFQNYRLLIQKNFMIGFDEGRQEQSIKNKIFSKTPVEDHVRNTLRNALKATFPGYFHKEKPPFP